MKNIYIFTILTFFSLWAWGQNIGDYGTIATGNWSNSDTWGVYDGSTYTNDGTTPDGSSDITILNGHTVTIAGGTTVTISSGNILDIASGGSLSIEEGDGFFTFDGVLNVEGTVLATGSISDGNTNNIVVKNGGVFQHYSASGGGTIPTATWESGSTCEILKIEGSPGGLGQNFFNFTYNNTTQTTAYIYLTGLNDVDGNLTINSSNSKFIWLVNSESTTINIDSSLIINGSSSNLILNNSGTVTINVGKDVEFTNGTSMGLRVNYQGTTTLNIERDFIANSSSGSIYLSNTNTPEVNIKGDFTGTAGMASHTNLNFNFTGNGSHELSLSSSLSSYANFKIKTSSTVTLGSNLAGFGAFTVEDGGTLDCSTYVCSGSGTFTLASGATIKTANATGLDGSINLDDTNDETFDDEANYTFNGSVAQTTGSSIPSPVNDLTIDNTSGVTLSKNIAINGALDVSGLLNASTYVLSDGGTGTATFNDGAILKTGHASGVTGSITIAAPSFTNTAVEYNGSVAQTTGLLGITGITAITINNGTNGVTLDASLSNFSGSLTVNNNCILDLGNKTISGTGNISFGSSATLRTGGANGVNSITLSGTKTFNTNNNFVFDGIIEQTLGSNIPDTVYSITINNTNGKVNMPSDQTIRTSVLDIAAGNYLNIVPGSGLTVAITLTLVEDEQIRIKSSATGQGSFIPPSGDYNVRVERYLETGRTWYFASPITSLAYDAFNAQHTQSQIFKWIANDTTWSEVTSGTFSANTSNLEGYILRVRNNSGITNIVGTLNNGDTYQTDASWEDIDYGWYLAGNPYCAALDASQISYGSSVKENVWVNANGNYQVYGTVSGESFGTLPNNNIAPMQAFWINAEGADPSISFGRDHIRHGGADNKLLKSNNQESFLTRIQLQVNRDSIYNDDIFVFLLDSASGNYDTYDMIKRIATNADFPQIYTLTDDNEKCIADVRPTFNNDTLVSIPIAFYNAFNEDTLTFATIDARNIYDYQTIWMVDSLTNDSIDILNNSYEFVTDSGLFDNRFYLHFGVESAAPQILAQSSSKNLCLGESTQLTVTAGGVPSPTYQWYGPNGAITDETNNILNLENTTQDQAGTYYCEVSNTGGTTQTDNIIVNIGTTPAFTDLTGDIETCTGTEINIAATVEANTYSPNKKWYFNGNELTEVGSGDIENSSASMQDEGYYYCEISNICGTVNSDSVYVDIKEAPEVSNEYANDQVCEGTDVAYTITGTGEGTITYQWYKDENAITGEETGTLNLTQVDLTAAGTYNCQVSNECGSVTSSNFILSVSEKPTVNMFNEEQHLCESTNTQLSANVTGVGSIDYTWYKDDVEVGNTEDLAFASVATADEGMYKLVVSDACGSDSAYTNLVVDAQLELTINNTDVTLCTGENLLLDATSNDNTGSVNYMWYRDNYSVASGLLTHSIENANLNDAGEYYLTGTNACGIASTDTVTVEVNQTPIVDLGEDIEIEQGNDTTLDAGVGNADYEWSTDEYTQTITVSDAGTYHVTVTKDGCSASDSVVVDVITDINTINNSFGIYPNPADKFLTIQTGLDNYTYSIYTIEGKLVLQENAQGNTTLNIEELSPGLYTLELKYKNNIIKEKLIIE